MRLLLAFLLAASLTGESLAQSHTNARIRNVNLKGDNECSYSYFLPRSYRSEKPCPVIFCFAPDGKGRMMLSRYVEACERVGWLAVASNDSTNGPLKLREIEAMRADCFERFSIDPKRVYVSGFSGGARVATYFAEKYGAAGHLAIGGVLGPSTRLLPDKSSLPRTAYFLLCGQNDFNLGELQQAERLLKQMDGPVRLQTFSGGHQMPRAEQIEEAILWLSEKSEAEPSD